MSTRDWNAAVYDRVSDPQFEWGVELVERLAAEGISSALDAGCGSGRVTAELAKRLPGARILACDAAPSMVELARQALPEAEVFECDLLELALERPVDLVFSSAVFHWIPDHDRLFERLHAALTPGGRLVAQCGGKGNIKRMHDAANAVAAESPFAEHLDGWKGPWVFASPEETAERLERAGFREIRTWLERKDAQPADPRSFTRTVNLRLHLDRLPEELREPFVEAVLERNPKPFVLEYVRLNIEATA
jgi:trans-aconitate 2-methyltransferase